MLNKLELPNNHAEVNFTEKNGGPWVKVDGVELLVEDGSVKIVGGDNDITRLTLTILPSSLTISA